MQQSKHILSVIPMVGGDVSLALTTLLAPDKPPRPTSRANIFHLPASCVNSVPRPVQPDMLWRCIKSEINIRLWSCLLRYWCPGQKPNVQGRSWDLEVFQLWLLLKVVNICKWAHWKQAYPGTWIRLWHLSTYLSNKKSPKNAHIQGKALLMKRNKLKYTISTILFNLCRLGSDDQGQHAEVGRRSMAVSFLWICIYAGRPRQTPYWSKTCQ